MLAKMRYRSGGEYPKAPVPVHPASPSWAAASRGGHYHSQSPEALFTHIPGLQVVCPSNPIDAKGLLASAIRGEDPVIFMEPKRVYRASKADVPEGERTPAHRPGQGRAAGRAGHAVIAWSAMVHTALEAASKGAEQGFDPRGHRSCARSCRSGHRHDPRLGSRKTGRVVVAHEAPRRNSRGSGAEIAATIQEKAMLHLEAPILRVTGFDTPFPYTLEQEYLPDANRNSSTPSSACAELLTRARLHDLRVSGWPDIGEGVVEGESRTLAPSTRAILRCASSTSPILVEIMTDKATVEIPAPRAGPRRQAHVRRRPAPCPVGKVLITILFVDEARRPESVAEGGGHAPPAAPARASRPAARPRWPPRNRTAAGPHVAAQRRPSARGRSDPCSRRPRRASSPRELGVELALAGFGLEERRRPHHVRDDVRRQATSGGARLSGPPPALPLSREPDDVVIPFRWSAVGASPRR